MRCARAERCWARYAHGRRALESKSYNNAYIPEARRSDIHKNQKNSNGAENHLKNK